MPSLLIASGNRHKVEEIRGILGERLSYCTLSDFPGAPKVIEDASDFVGNAAKKALALAEWLPANSGGRTIDFVLADDSGLEVDALNGAPGVHSARFAALDSGSPGNSPDAANNEKLLRLLAEVPDGKRTARFRCVIAWIPVPAAHHASASPVCSASEAELGTQIFDGACEGRILRAPRGGHGFGYDPLFVPNGFRETFAELGEPHKSRISHRSAALRKLQAKIANFV